MIDADEKFLLDLEKALKNHPNRKEIVADYAAYIYELTADLAGEVLTYDLLVDQLGMPKDIAKKWRVELQSTPRKTKWIFFLTNAIIFGVGLFITVGYHIFEIKWIGHIWHTLTSIMTVVFIVYTLFWGLLGYEIGKEFGQRGKKLLKKTVTISIIPNICLMLLVIFEIIPLKWFEPYLTVPFIIGCILLTGLFYPISLLGYRWGRRDSV